MVCPVAKALQPPAHPVLAATAVETAAATSPAAAAVPKGNASTEVVTQPTLALVLLHVAVYASLLSKCVGGVSADTGTSR